MIVLNTKTFQELQDEGLSELTALGFSSNPGAICRLFLSVINNRVAAAYRALTVNHIRAFLSTSDGEALDMIGSLLNCKRNGDNDEDYKYRISKQCLVLATSNETAVRLAALSVDGVADVKLKPHGMGAGTFVVLVVVDNESKNPEGVLEKVRKQIATTVGYGIKFRVDTPTLTRIKLGFKLYIKDTVTDFDAQTIRYDVQQAISDYINNLVIGEDIMIDQITQEIMNVSDDIVSHQNTSFYINNQKALYVNQSCRWFEKFALSTDVDNIIVS
jgi:hypothetical protein